MREKNQVLIQIEKEKIIESRIKLTLVSWREGKISTKEFMEKLNMIMHDLKKIEEVEEILIYNCLP